MSATTGRAPVARTSASWSGIADERAHLVAACAEQRRQAQRDLAVPAGDDDVAHREASRRSWRNGRVSNGALS